LRSNRRTVNAGVFGYGAAQAVRRASIVTRKKNFDTIILSILVNDDFHRDRMSFRLGFPRPAVIQSENGLSYADVPPIESRGTKWQPRHISKILLTVKNHSILINKFLEKFDLTGMRRTEIHENAANINQIIEFTTRELSSLDVRKKFIVLQYSQNDFLSQTIESQEIRKLIHLESQSRGIQVIDTYDRLQAEINNSNTRIWNGHHTAHGNEIVCDEIYQVVQNSK